VLGLVQARVLVGSGVISVKEAKVGVLRLNSAQEATMIVISLEGCHGCGKTELSRRFAEHGFVVLDEGFLDMPSFGIHPQSLLMETRWVCSWFERLLQRANEMKLKGISHENVVYITDRSPYSAVFYCHFGVLLAPVIGKQMEEVKMHADIHIYTVHVSVNEEVLWKRVQERLRHEPDRAFLNEDKREWLNKVLDFYSNFKWDVVVDNSEHDDSGKLDDLLVRTVAEICGKIPPIAKAVKKEHASLWRQLVTIPELPNDDESIETALFNLAFQVEETSATSRHKRIRARAQTTTTK